MEPEEKKKIEEEILEQRRLPYSIRLIEVQGDKYIIENTFGSQMTYVKKDGLYSLEE